MTLNLGLVKQLVPTTARPYRLIESFVTSDGIRSRICDGTWASEEDALKELERRLAEIKK